MTRNDPFRHLFALRPWAVAAIVWAWGFGSLVLYSGSTGSIQDVLLRHPGFMVGDFFLLPAAAFLIAWFYRTAQIRPGSPAAHLAWNVAGAAAATIMTAVSLVRNGLLSWWFAPHAVFYWFMACLLIVFFPRAAVQLVLDGGDRLHWLMWTLALIAVGGHILLPVVFGPKVLPRP